MIVRRLNGHDRDQSLLSIESSPKALIRRPGDRTDSTGHEATPYQRQPRQVSQFVLKCIDMTNGNGHGASSSVRSYWRMIDSKRTGIWSERATMNSASIYDRAATVRWEPH